VIIILVAMSLPGLCSLITRRIEEQQTSHKNTVVSNLQLNKRKKHIGLRAQFI
jgi:hypothetical protein